MSRRRHLPVESALEIALEIAVSRSRATAQAPLSAPGHAQMQSDRPQLTSCTLPSCRSACGL